MLRLRDETIETSLGETGKEENKENFRVFSSFGGTESFQFNGKLRVQMHCFILCFR